MMRTSWLAPAVMVAMVLVLEAAMGLAGLGRGRAEGLLVWWDGWLGGGRGGVFFWAVAMVAGLEVGGADAEFAFGWLVARFLFSCFSANSDIPLLRLVASG